MKVTERVVQTVLMAYAMGKKHDLIVPNSRELFWWEADLVSVTKAGLVHEYEIKIDLADYHRDFEKENKHQRLATAGNGHGLEPNYFWYVTWGFDIEPPEHAGWIRIEKGYKRLVADEQIPAPRLHGEKISEKKRRQAARMISYRLMNLYDRLWPDSYEHPTEAH